MTPAPILLAAGGTGGHMFPAEALAAELLGRGRNLILVTDARGSVFGGALAALPRRTVAAGTSSGRSLAGKVAGLTQAARGTLQARRLMAECKPAAVIGFGGYPALPTMIAASWAGVPSLVHEQNAVLGRVNRFLAPRVSAIALSFSATAKLRGSWQTKTQVIGNPVRPEIAAIPEYAPPTGSGPIRLLVTGGSQGAAVFARVVPAAVAALSQDLGDRLIVAQQCRTEDHADVAALYHAQGIHADLGAFFSNLPERLAEAHLVVCRAGASTIAELAAAGRPALLVPYPHAVDDHQDANAGALEDAGGAWMVEESQFTPENLATTLTRLLTEPQVLARAAAHARAQGRAGAARDLADMVDRLAAASGGALPVQGRVVAEGEPAE